MAANLSTPFLVTSESHGLEPPSVTLDTRPVATLGEALLAAGRRDEVEQAMSDRWLSDCTLFGPADRVRDGFAAWREIGVEPIAVMSSTSGGQVKAIGELFDLYD